MDTSLLKNLCEAVGVGHLTEASDIAEKELAKYCCTERFGQTGVIGLMNNGKEKTIMLEAHIDQVGFTVTTVFPDGFLKVAPVGGNDGRILPATPIRIHSDKGEYPTVFASTPPHLSDGKNDAKSCDELLLDSMLGQEACSLISAGDMATYKSDFTPLAENRVSACALDDRAGVFCLLEVAKRLYDKDLDVNVVFCLAEQEELGLRGSRCAAYKYFCDEAVVVDVSFGDAPDISPDKAKKLGVGALIGLSPILSKKVSDKLISCAKEKDISFDYEVMGGATGTDADVISVTASGIPCGLLSIPLRNMHTPVEVADLNDIESVCDILEEYVLSGGAV